MMINFLTSKDLGEVLKTKVKLKIPISGISINSKLVKKGDLFIPIKGKNYDGHKFIKEALNKGAVTSLANPNFFKKLKLNKYKNKIIFVNNPRVSLNDLALFSRSRIKGKILGITGSLGKTSVKDAISFILKKQFKIQSSQGNLNNLIGLPLSLARLNKDIDFGILELGMNKKGEIKKLSNICKPDVALITKISNAHIGNFHGLKDIALAKSEIFSGMNNKGIAILNNSDPYLSLLKHQARLAGVNDFIFFGKSNNSDIALLKVDYKKNNKYKIFVNAAGRKINFILNNFGEHWIENSLAIISFLISVKVNPDVFIKEISNFSATKGRGNILKINFNKKKFEIIDDSYNSSPESLSASLNFLNIYGNKKRKICVLGDMKELGKFSKNLHLNIKKNIKKNKISMVYTIGNEMKNLFDVLPGNIKGSHSEDLDELFLNLKKFIKSDDVILFKGSRKMQLDKIIKKF